MDAKQYFERGTGKLIDEDYVGAMQDFSAALQLDPEHAQAYYNRGLSWTALEDFFSAIADYDRCIELDSTFANAYYFRGEAYAKLGHKDREFSDYQVAAQMYFKQGHTSGYFALRDRLKQLQNLNPVASDSVATLSD